MHLSSQSAPTILVLKTWVGLRPWKNIGSKIWGANRMMQKSRAGCFFSVLNNNDPVFLYVPCFLQPIFWTSFFQGHYITDPCFQNENSGCRLTWLGYCILRFSLKSLFFSIFFELICMSNHYKLKTNQHKTALMKQRPGCI